MDVATAESVITRQVSPQCQSPAVALTFMSLFIAMPANLALSEYDVQNLIKPSRVTPSGLSRIGEADGCKGNVKIRGLRPNCIDLSRRAPQPLTGNSRRGGLSYD